MVGRGEEQKEREAEDARRLAGIKAQAVENDSEMTTEEREQKKLVGKALK